MYATHAFGAGKKMVSSFVLVRDETGEEKEIWMGRVLMLLRCAVGGSKDGIKMAFVQCRERVISPDAVGGALECVRLRRAAAEGGQNESYVDSLERANNRTAAEERFGAIVFERFWGLCMLFRQKLLYIRLLQKCHGTVTGFTLIGSAENLG